MTRFAIYLFIPLCLLCLVPAASLAQEVAASPEAVEAVTPAVVATDSAFDTVGDLVGSIRLGNWREAAAASLMLLMLGFGSVRNRIKWLAGDRGGVVSVFALSFAGAIATSLMGESPVDGKMFLTAAGIALTAIGGFHAIKQFFWPRDQGDG